MEKHKLWDMNARPMEEIMEVLGTSDCNLKMVAEHFGADITVESGELVTENEEAAAKMADIFQKLEEIYAAKGRIDTKDVAALLHNEADTSFFKEVIASGAGSRKFYLRTKGQKELFDAFENSDITVVTGPAGTGKTFLAVVYASNLLKKGLIRKIIVTRPVVEAGESLGFLPGDLKEKVDPYLRPIYDSLEEIFGRQNVEKMVERGIVEIAPLAYMRGRTLSDACIILDEAQNTTQMQIKMFLTRLGFNSKMIITGDITQVDLPKPSQSGLVKALDIIKDIEGISIVEMSRKDVVRHPLVQKIIEAYEKKGI